MGVNRDVIGYVISMFDVAFQIRGSYVASFGILVRIHPLSNGIWWRWRTAGSKILDWADDHDPHSTIVEVESKKYEFSIRGESSFFGRDDLAVELKMVK